MATVADLNKLVVFPATLLPAFVLLTLSQNFELKVATVNGLLESLFFYIEILLAWPEAENLGSPHIIFQKTYLFELAQGGMIKAPKLYQSQLRMLIRPRTCLLFFSVSPRGLSETYIRPRCKAQQEKTGGGTNLFRRNLIFAVITIIWA